MASVHRRRDPEPRRLEDEPEFKRLVELLRRGKVEPERLDAHIQQRQAPLFPEGGEDGKNEN
jgi:hypothetical protein